MAQKPLDASTGPLARFAAGLVGGKAVGPSSGIIISMEDKPLQPGEWIDDLPDPLETKADVEDLFARVEVLKAKRKAEAIRKASLN